MKVLFLILASDGGIYTELQSIWRQYIHSIPWIEAYFYKANPNLHEEIKIEGDILWVRCSEGLGTVSLKLKLALRAFEHRFNEFDYICRPNLSSFFILDRYRKALDNLPKEKSCMAKEHVRPCIFPTGAGFTITPDIAKAILADPFPQHVPGGDDVSVGSVLQKLGIKIRNVPRLDITNTVHWNTCLNTLHKDTSIFHVRVKHSPAERIKNDIQVMKKLLDTYCAKQI
jgi:hypothetical protein